MANQLGKIDHIVQLMLENRSFDHMLGFLYADSGNVSPAGHGSRAALGSPVLTHTAQQRRLFRRRIDLDARLGHHLSQIDTSGILQGI